MNKNTLATATALAVATTLSTPALAQSQSERIDALEQKVDALSSALDARGGSGGSDTTVNGYGEIHYNDTEPDSGGEGTEQVDFHRFIIELGHEFTGDLRFYSELEFEHAVLEPELETETDPATGNVSEAELENEGELKLEQGYIEFDLSQRQRVQAGLFLMPVGILNETHEPPRFYGVERNQVESTLLPTTWAETGALFKGSLGGTGLSYDLGVHTGLNSADGVIEEGVGLAAKQPAETFAATGRVKYTGVSGLEIAASTSYQDDLSQGSDADDAGSATLLTGHARYSIAGFQLTGLAANWSVDGNVADAAEDQTGGYVEAAYRPIESLGVFVRQASEDFYNGTDVDRDTTTAGINYWPHPDVVIKVDAQEQDAEVNANAADSVNVGLGWQF